MKLSIDSRVSFVATFIALMALFFSILDHYQNRKHNKKTVTPILIIEVQEVNSRYGIFLSNQGYGPAIIDSCIIFYDNIKMDDEDPWSEVFKTHFLIPLDFVIESNPISNGLVVKSGETKLAWGAKTTDLQGNRHLLQNSIKHISIRIHYHSIYDDKSKVEFK